MNVGIDVSSVPDGPGGVSTYVRGLTDALGKSELGNITLIDSSASRVQAWPDAMAVRSVVPKNRLTRLAYERTMLGGKLDGLNVLHSPHYSFAKRKGMSNVVTIHDMTFFTRPQDHSKYKRIWFRNAIERASAQASHLICVSQATSELLKSICNPKCEVSVIHHGIDHTLYSTVPNASDEGVVEAQLGPNINYILFVGTIEPRKNIGNLISAYLKMVATTKAVVSEVPILVLIGRVWPSEMGKLQAMITKAKDSEPRATIKWLSDVTNNDLASFYRRSSCFVYVSFEEGFGLPVLEAMACGASVVTTRDSVMQELCLGAAILVDPNSPQSIAEGLAEALGPNASATTNADNALGIAKSYSWTKCAQEHYGVYESLKVMGS